MRSSGPLVTSYKCRCNVKGYKKGVESELLNVCDNLETLFCAVGCTDSCRAICEHTATLGLSLQTSGHMTYIQRCYPPAFSPVLPILYLSSCYVLTCLPMTCQMPVSTGHSNISPNNTMIKVLPELIPGFLGAPYYHTHCCEDCVPIWCGWRE
jgi:hypothetical protein